MPIKAALVTTRYGLEVNGGAELHCRRVAEHLNTDWEVEVLSTCAHDFTDWKNHYPEGIEEINEVKVHRFLVDQTRPKTSFDKCYDLLVNLHLLASESEKQVGKCENDVERLLNRPQKDCFQNEGDAYPHLFEQIEAIESIWMNLQGPVSTSLSKYVAENKNNYDIFIFFTLGYWTSFACIPLVSNKSALVPTLHKEACMAFNIYKRLVNHVSYFLFNTPEEQKLCHTIFPSTKSHASDIVGLGFEKHAPQAEQESIERDVLIKTLPEDPFLLYMGRVDESKGCLNLAKMFTEFVDTRHCEISLVLVGQVLCELPTHKNIYPLGFVDDHQKNLILQKAGVFVMPSAFESLSMALMEAWTAKIPAIVNSECEVLKAHCERSGGGLSYRNQQEFDQALIELMGNTEQRKKLGIKGKAYVDENYCWQKVREKYQKCLHHIQGRKNL